MKQLIPMHHACQRLGRQNGYPIDVYGICVAGCGGDECLRQGHLSEAKDLDVLPGEELRVLVGVGKNGV